MRVVLMEERLTAREIGAYIELRKRVAEEEYKLDYVKSTAGDHSQLIEEMEEGLKEERARMKVIEGKLEGKGLMLVVPNQKKIDDITELLSRLPEGDVQSAIKSRGGDAYVYLTERGKYIKRNIEARNEIGKLNILLAGAEEDVRICAREALINGKPGGKAADFENDAGRKIIRLLNRVGVRCSYEGGKLVADEGDTGEKRVVVNNEYFWVPAQKIAQFTENEKLMSQVSVKLQVKNAEMQAITFNKEEQEEFNELQGQYLDMLKARREIIGKEEEELMLSI